MGSLHHRSFAGLVSSLCLSLGCSQDPPGSVPAEALPDRASHTPAPELYERDRVVEVAVEIAPDDWQALRAEGRSLFDVFLERNLAFAYTPFTASVTVDGLRHDNVSIQKKGFLGSLSQRRPGLRLDFARGSGMRRMTLNNNRQDPSRVRQCLAYWLFSAAGIPAPACNLAHVTVNGEDMGTYSNVEPIRKPFLARHFSSDAGNLYEGELADFTLERLDRFELDVNDASSDRADLERLARTLDASDDELFASLNEVLDVDRFRDFWAMEALLGHWDGYGGNTNNFYVYADPGSGRMHFIPWGADGSFTEDNPGDDLNPTLTVFANGRIANRLYHLPAQRDRYRARLGEIVDEHWQESVLVSQLDRLTRLAPDASPAAIAEVQSYLLSRGDRVREELAQAPWEWQDAPPRSPCRGTVGDVNIAFETDFGDLDMIDPAAGRFEVSLSLDGTPYEVSTSFGRAGVDPTATDQSLALRVLTVGEDGNGVFLQMNVPASEFAPGSRPLYALESVGLVSMFQGGFVGFVSEGTLEFDSASAVEGAPVSGRLAAQLVQLECAR